jgi:Fe-S cluster assembly protein SufD
MLNKIFNHKNSLLIDLDNNNYNNLNSFFNIKYSPKSIIINILDNIIIKQPIYIINNNNIINNNINIIINSGKNNKFILIDHKNNQNNITYINCFNNSEIEYYLIQNNIKAELQINQQANSKINAVILENNLNNNNNLKLKINLIEPDTKVYLNILQNTKNSNISDIDLIINHLTTNSSSYTVSRAMADDTSIANLTGRIIVNTNAAKTSADLQTKGLILSKQAIINSCPELDIYNNDIACTHGASIGHLDLDALLYMQTRGINLIEAKQMLLQAFIEPIIQAIKIPEILNII